MFFVTDLRLSVNMNIHVGSRFVRFIRVFELSFGTGTNLTFKCPNIASAKSKSKVPFLPQCKSRFPPNNIGFQGVPSRHRTLKRRHLDVVLTSRRRSLNVVCGFTFSKVKCLSTSLSEMVYRYDRGEQRADTTSAYDTRRVHAKPRLQTSGERVTRVSR